MKPFRLLFLSSLCFISCKDQGEIVEYLEITSLTPTSGSVGIDKAMPIELTFNHPIDFRELNKISVRYLDDTTTIQAGWLCGYCPTVLENLWYGPFIWKPGRNVEVQIPNTLRDENGRQLQHARTVRFSIAEDSSPFSLLETIPRQGDTIAVPSQFFFNFILKFSDYARLSASHVTISPNANIVFPVIMDAYLGPQKNYYFALKNLLPNRTYTITVSDRVTDYEGETLPQDYRIVFYTKP